MVMVSLSENTQNAHPHKESDTPDLSRNFKKADKLWPVCHCHWQRSECASVEDYLQEKVPKLTCMQNTERRLSRAGVRLAYLADELSNLLALGFAQQFVVVARPDEMRAHLTTSGPSPSVLPPAEMNIWMKWWNGVLRGANEMDLETGLPRRGVATCKTEVMLRRVKA